MSENREDNALNSYRSLFEKSADAILIIRGDMFVDCNAAAIRMLRSDSKEKVLKTHPSELSPPFQPDGKPSFDKANEMMEIALAEGSHRFEWEHVRMNGEVFPVEVLLTVIPTEDGSELHTVWRDISDRKKLEAELRHSQKMETIGQLAGGIAHDFNNQLVPIMGFAELLRNKLKHEKDLERLAIAIEEAGARAADLVSRLMSFSHKAEKKSGTVDLNLTIESLLDMLLHLIGEDVDIRFDQARVPLPVNMTEGDVEQIVMNLATNARDAMPMGGVLTLSLSKVMHEDQLCACLSVTDEGYGMDESTASLIFEPFFTTKDVGSGTGLGLSTVFSLVSQAGGEIDVETARDSGTSFRLYLPISNRPVALRESLSDQGAESNLSLDDVDGQAGSRHILLVEDDDSVATLVRNVLEQDGYRVTHYDNGSGPLALKSLDDYAMILSDVVMPGVSGPEMVAKLRQRGLDKPVVFMSGYTDDRLKTHGFDEQNIRLLRKPFAPRELLAEVELVFVED